MKAKWIAWKIQKLFLFSFYSNCYSAKIIVNPRSDEDKSAQGEVWGREKFFLSKFIVYLKAFLYLIFMQSETRGKINTSRKFLIKFFLLWLKISSVNIQQRSNSQIYSVFACEA